MFDINKKHNEIRPANKSPKEEQEKKNQKNRDNRESKQVKPDMRSEEGLR